MPNDDIINKIHQYKQAEKVISRHLFWIAATITVLVMAVFTVQFFTRGAFPPQDIGFFYMGVVLIYSLHKEMIRWVGERRKKQRQGEVFVYAWIALTVTLYIINFLSKDYFGHSPEGESVHVLREIASITLQVLVIFIITRFMKLINILSRANVEHK